MQMARRINAKLVLELLGKGMTGREIYRSRRIAQQSVKKVREAARTKGVTWEELLTVSPHSNLSVGRTSCLISIPEL